MTDVGFALFSISRPLQASNPKFLGLSSQLQDMVRCGVLKSDHVGAWEGSHPSQTVGLFTYWAKFASTVHISLSQKSDDYLCGIQFSTQPRTPLP